MSDIPSRPQCELRALVRYRPSLQPARATEAHRIQKVLEGADVKRNVLGVTGQRIPTALADGVTGPVA
ncbi:MAG: hypothetical protein OWU84_00660 [Firmicutes bacterium]|nr:hypothetical protein [Bacillota bacterium]